MTVAGKPSAAELQDLLANKDAAVAAVAKAYQSDPNRVTHSDPTWSADWSTLQTRYSAAAGQARSLISRASNSVLPMTLRPAGDEYSAILRALSPIPNIVTRGSFQDLVNRISRAGAQPDLRNLPQPRLGTDADLSVFQSTDKAARGVTTAAVDATSWIPFAGPYIADAIRNAPLSPQVHLPWDDDNRNPKNKPRDEDKGSHFWLYTILGALAGFIGLNYYVVKKTKEVTVKYGPAALSAASVVQPELAPFALAAMEFKKKKEEADGEDRKKIR